MVLAGCTLASSRQEESSKKQIAQKNDVELVGDVAGLPVNIKIEHTGTQQEESQTDATKQISSPAAESGLGLILSLILGLTTGGIGYAIKGKMSGTLIRKLVQGIECIKQEAPAAKEMIHQKLRDQGLTDSEKTHIKKVKKK